MTGIGAVDRVTDRPSAGDRARYGLTAAALLLAVEVLGDLVYRRTLLGGTALDGSWVVACGVFAVVVALGIDRDARRARSAWLALAAGTTYFTVGTGLWLWRSGGWHGGADEIWVPLVFALVLDWTLTAAVVIAYAGGRWAARRSPPVGDWLRAAEEDEYL